MGIEMNATAEAIKTPQIATFHVGNLLLGVNIDAIQEINRQLDVTKVPHAPGTVLGVINLRGEVVTVVDIRTLLGMEKREIIDKCRCVVIHSQDELIGVLVDSVADILPIPENQIEPAPANIDGVDGRFFQGVHAMDNGVVVLLDVEQLLEAC
jgi:purine-binding chemotaxis protein CheW